MGTLKKKLDKDSTSLEAKIDDLVKSISAIPQSITALASKIDGFGKSIASIQPTVYTRGVGPQTGTSLISASSVVQPATTLSAFGSGLQPQFRLSTGFGSGPSTRQPAATFGASGLKPGVGHGQAAQTTPTTIGKPASSSSSSANAPSGAATMSSNAFLTRQASSGRDTSETPAPSGPVSSNEESPSPPRKVQRTNQSTAEAESKVHIGLLISIPATGGTDAAWANVRWLHKDTKEMLRKFSSESRRNNWTDNWNNPTVDVYSRAITKIKTQNMSWPDQDSPCGPCTKAFRSKAGQERREDCVYFVYADKDMAYIVLKSEPSKARALDTSHAEKIRLYSPQSGKMPLVQPPLGDSTSRAGSAVAGPSRRTGSAVAGPFGRYVRAGSAAGLSGRNTRSGSAETTAGHVSNDDNAEMSDL